jgi:hypothetical protein
MFAVGSNEMKRLSVLFLSAEAILWASSNTHTVIAQSARVRAEAERVTGDAFSISVRTPQGANVYALHQPSPLVLKAVDQGLTELFAVARKNGYSRRLSYSDYSVYIGRADRTTDYQGKYSPDIQIPVAQYAGTVFDKGGYMYAAGMVISLEPCAFVIAEHTKDLQRISNVVRYEGEHLVLYHNDRDRFEATKDHSQGGAHPILN